ENHLFKHALSLTFAIFGLLSKEESPNCLELLELGNGMNKRRLRPNSWKQKQLGKKWQKSR
ncbi:MAG: hypothetical protein NZ602_02645, partial [Thermoguttaceae bacterium]|nr:hypothetical protein [Thermoguttaceae bacterium]